MKRTKDDYLALLQETIDHYSEDTSRRAVHNDSCQYLTDDGRMCAVGRCLKPEENTARIKFKYPNQIDNNVEEGLDGLLQDAYKGFSTSFWTQLQKLHDYSKNWGVNSLSAEGESEASGMRALIEEGQYE